MDVYSPPLLFGLLFVVDYIVNAYVICDVNPRVRVCSNRFFLVPVSGLVWSTLSCCLVQNGTVYYTLLPLAISLSTSHSHEKNTR